MKLMHKFAEMKPELRPQDPHRDGTDLHFETMEHGGGISRRNAPSHQAERRRRSFLHLRADYARRQGGRQSGVSVRCGGWMIDNSQRVPDVSANIEIGESPERPPRDGGQ